MSRYQCYFDFLENWHKVGFIIQGVQIPDAHGGDYGVDYGVDKFLATARLRLSILPGLADPFDAVRFPVIDGRGVIRVSLYAA